jgi:hypothetical protein
MSEETELWRRIHATTGRRAIAWSRPDCGLSAALRFAVRFHDGTPAFVKAATDNDTERWLRTEYAALDGVRGAFMPAVVGWIDESRQRPILLTADFSGAYWPASHRGVTWRPGDVDALFATIAEVSATRAPGTLPALEVAPGGWPSLTGASAALEREGVCSAAWLGRALPALIEAEAALEVGGSALVHGDIRSDNVCIEGGRAILVDWSHAARGNGDHNLASVLDTLHLEGGPPPASFRPAAGPWAAAAAAATARRLLAGGGPEWLRDVLRRLAIIDLDWAAAALRLPPREGRDWTDA